MVDKSQMVIHCGGVNVERETLLEILPPEATDTYFPISHAQLTEMVHLTAADLLGMELVRETYAVANDGNRFFGLQTFSPPALIDEQEFGLSIGFRNSYDRSMSIGFAMGFRVFICDNLAISGDIRYCRKHTKNAWPDVENTLIALLYKKGRNLQERFEEDVHGLKHKHIDRTTGLGLLTELFLQKAMSPPQLVTACQDWKQEEELTKWRLYNAATHALKTTPPGRILENHQAVHHLLAA